MSTTIKLFQVSSQWIDDRGDFTLAEVQKEVLRMFDEWVEAEKPKILSIQFGTYFNRYKSPEQFWDVEVLYYR